MTHGSGKRSQGKFQGSKRIASSAFIKPTTNPEERRQKQKDFWKAMDQVSAELRAKERGQEYVPLQQGSSSEVIYHSTKRPLTEYSCTTLGIPTFTSYVFDRHSEPVVVIRPKAKSSKISFCSIKETEYGLSYGIKKLSDERIELNPHFLSFYQGLSEILSDREAQNELNAIEQTIRNKKSSIEQHLGTKISLD
jgi:hypothetical protein